MKSIAVMNIKGGVGKTSTAVALAAGIKRSKPQSKILLIDADPQGSVKTNFSLKLHSYAGDFAAFLIDDAPLSHAIQPVRVDHDASIDVMISSRRLSDADVKMSTYPRREETLKFRFKKNSVDYDYVVFDTSPAMSIVTLNILTFADYLLIPATMDAFALSNINYLLEQTKVVEEFYEKAPTVLGILPTMFDRRTSISTQALDVIRKKFGEEFRIFPPIGVDAAIKKAQIRRRVIYDIPGSRAATQYNDLTTEILNMIEGRDETTRESQVDVQI